MCLFGKIAFNRAAHILLIMELVAAVTNRNDEHGVRDRRKVLNHEILFRRIR